MSFSESVPSGNVDVSKLVLQNAVVPAGAESFSLSGGTVFQLSNTEIRVNLAAIDLNAIKNNTELAIDANLVAAPLEEELLSMNGVEVVNVHRAANKCIPGGLDAADLQAFRLTWMHRAPSGIRRQLLHPVSLRGALRSRQQTGVALSLLSSQSVLNSGGVDGTIITIAISVADANTIKNNVNLATEQGDTFISFAAGSSLI